MKQVKDLISRAVIEKKNAVQKLFSLASLGDLFEKASELAEEIYETSDILKDIREELESDIKDAPGLPKRQRIRDAIVIHEYHEDVSSQKDILALLELTVLKSKIEREILRHVIQGAHAYTLGDLENTLFLKALDIQDAYDRLYLTVREELLVKDDTFESFLRKHPEFKNTGGKTDPLLVQEYLTTEGIPIQGTDAYSYSDIVFRKSDDGKIIPLSWASAYPQETQAVGDAIQQLLTAIKDFQGTQADHYKSYFEALYKAVTTADVTPEEKNTLWRTVDSLWIDNTSDMQFIHMIESYWDHALGRRQEPELNISFRDMRYKRVNDNIQMLKPKQFALLQEWYGDTVDPIGSFMRSDSGTFTKVSSGARLYFRDAGQNVPNRPEVRQNKGVRIFQDMHTMDQRAERQKRLLNKLLGEEKRQEIFPDKEYREMTEMLAGLFVPGHEFGHNAFITVNLYNKLTPHITDQLEEHKSDLTSIAVMPHILNPQEQRIMVKAYFADLLRSLTHHDSHRNGGLSSMYNFFEAGILELHDQTWMLDFSDEKLQVFFTLEKADLDTMHDIYLEPDTETARQKAQEPIQRYVDAEKDLRMQALLEAIQKAID